ncbi:unnamed protein product [Tuber melanosporum]|uniref:(Perigord truffle) hypothetical protein n=1 Tax=Tuber melanosporum (strain Mel28) TaxID=656061 RepID=D5GE78_TUBMM|nr:uncharacterized protein GSTUM_00006414001 [Tuber melanosporum]CAZ82821.1 unnamed protein product [Tuber melanosporum]
MNRFQETKFFNSIRARLNKLDEDTRALGSFKPQKKKQKEGEGTPLVVRRRSGSLVPGIGSIPNSDISTPLPPPLPVKNEDRLPKHSNVFTGVPTPTETAANSRNHSSANSVDAGSGSKSPNTTRKVRRLPSLEASLKEYCYIEEPKEKNELAKMPSAKEPQPFTNPGKTAGEVESLENDATPPKAKGKGSFLGVGGPEVGGPGSCQSQPWKNYVSQRNPQQQRQRLPGQSPLRALKGFSQNRQTRTQGLIEELPGQGQIFIPSVSQRLHSWKPEGEVRTMRERLRTSTSTSTSPLLKYMRPPIGGALAPNPEFTLPFLRSATISSDELPRFSKESPGPLHPRQDSELFLQPTKVPSTPGGSTPGSPPMRIESVGIPELEAVLGAGISAGWDANLHDPSIYARPKIPRRNALILSSDPGSLTGVFIDHQGSTGFESGYAAQMPPTPPRSSYSPSVGRSVDGDRHDQGRESVSGGEHAKAILGRAGSNLQVHPLSKGMSGFVPFLHQIREVMISRDESLSLMNIWHILLMGWVMWALAKLLGIGIELVRVVILEPSRILCYALKRWLSG